MVLQVIVALSDNWKPTDGISTVSSGLQHKQLATKQRLLNLVLKLWTVILSSWATDGKGCSN